MSRGRRSPSSRRPAVRDADFLATSVLGGQLALSPGKATLANRHGRALTMTFPGSDRGARASALEELPGKANVLLGDDPARWRTGLSTYGRIRYGSVYPGIDVDFYGDQRGFEYDFRVAPGADPRPIAVDLGGADRLRLTPGGRRPCPPRPDHVRQRAPVAYQDIAGARRAVDAAFTLDGDRLGLELGAYDRSRPLVVDPQVEFSTFLGGDRSDQANDVVARWRRCGLRRPGGRLRATSRRLPRRFSRRTRTTTTASAPTATASSRSTHPTPAARFRSSPRPTSAGTSRTSCTASTSAPTAPSTSAVSRARPTTRRCTRSRRTPTVRSTAAPTARRSSATAS